MSSPVKAGFEFESVTLRVEDILPTKQIDDTIKEQSRYLKIVASIKEVGIIEPPVVHREGRGKYSVLDGNARLSVLREMGVETVECLVATDDESYTYNHKINRVAPVQANRMIMKALEAGVPPERIARALGLQVQTVLQNRTALKGICPEAIELLKDKPVTLGALREFKRVQPIRQIEMAELMNSGATYTIGYARSLVVRTKPEQLVEAERTKQAQNAKPEDLARIEAEIESVEKDFLLVDGSHDKNAFNLTLARSYVKSLLDNSKVVRYLAEKHRDLLAEFQRIVEMAAEG